MIPVALLPTLRCHTVGHEFDPLAGKAFLGLMQAPGGTEDVEHVGGVGGLGVLPGGADRQTGGAVVQKQPDQRDQQEQDQADDPSDDDQQSEEEQDQEQGEGQPQQLEGLTEEQARQLLEAAAEGAESLEEFLQQILVVPGGSPLEDW